MTDRAVHREANQVVPHNKTYVVLVALIVAIGGFLLGFDSTVISGAIDFIGKQFHLSEIQVGFAAGCLILGAMGGNAVAGSLSDRFGRKKVLIVTALLYAVSALLTAFAPDYYTLVTARMLCGVAVGMAILIAPVYIAEISPSRYRGTLVSFNQLNIVVGISASFFSNYFLLIYFKRSHPELLEEIGWRVMLGMEAIPAVLYFLLLFFVPESPRWLFGKGHEEEAKAILARAGGDEHADEEFARIRASFAEKSGGTSFFSLFSKKMRFIMFIALALAFFQQITGINAILYYSPIIFAKAGAGQDAAFMSAILLGLTNLVMTIVAMLVIDQLGRKPLLVIGSIGMAASLFLSSWGYRGLAYQLTPAAIETLAKNNKFPRELLDKLKPDGTKIAVENDFVQELKNKYGDKLVDDNRKPLTEAARIIEPIQLGGHEIQPAYVILAAIMGFIASFAISIGPVMWVMLSEIFPNNLRGLAISLVGFWNSVVSFTVTTVFPWQMYNFGSVMTYLFYGIMAALTLVFVLLFIPETKGKTLEELEVMLASK